MKFNCWANDDYDTSCIQLDYDYKPAVYRVGFIGNQQAYDYADAIARMLGYIAINHRGYYEL